MKIAILGYGIVGKGVYDIVTKNKINFIEVAKILRRKGSKKDLTIITDNIDEIINDDSIDTVVECLGGLEPARTYVTLAMQHGKNVVTSNKLLLATCYDELVKLSQEKNVYLLFEASVGGGIPFIENLIRISYVDEVTGFKGIINATINYILYRMTTEGIDFDVALKEAQDKGYAEQDPSSDIDGDDVLYKTIVAANAASKKSFSISNVLKFGVRNITKDDIAVFKENNLVCKLIAEYDGIDKILLVMPELFDKYTAIANVPLNNNYIEIYCRTEGRLAFEGQGAGRYPTAHSVVQDLVRINQNVAKPMLTTEKVTVCYNDFKEKFYVKKKGEKGKFVVGMNEKELRSDDILFVAKVNND